MTDPAGAAPIPALHRYALAVLGPVIGAGAQFLFSLILLARLDTDAFGRVAFLMVVGQLGIAVWSALFCAPLLVAMARVRGGARDAAVQALVTTAFVAIVPAAILFVLIAGAVGVRWPAALVFGGYAALVVARAFARAWGYAAGTPRRTILSDLAYGGALLAATAVIVLLGATTIAGALTALLVSGFIGMLPFAGGRLGAVLAASSTGALRDYRPVWGSDSRWTLLGVVTTELTVNSHSYLVVALAGPGRYAPIAATALLVRPVTVGTNALVEFERARFARGLAAGAVDHVRRERRQLHLALAGLWLVTGLASLAVLRFAPQLLSHGKFTPATLVLGAVLWFAVTLARIAHAPEGAVLQAAGRFRELAHVSVWTSLVSIAAVLFAILAVGPMWSIAGIAVGEGCFAVALWRAAGRLLAGEPQRPAMVGG